MQEQPNVCISIIAIFDIFYNSNQFLLLLVINLWLENNSTSDNASYFSHQVDHQGHA